MACMPEQDDPRILALAEALARGLARAHHAEEMAEAAKRAAKRAARRDQTAATRSRKAVTQIILALMLAVLVGGTAWAAVSTKDVLACEAAIKSQLKAPATYKRASVSRTSEPRSYREFILFYAWAAGHMTSAEGTAYLYRNVGGMDFPGSPSNAVVVEHAFEEYRSLFPDERHYPTVTTITIQFDAQNSYGALLRGQGSCQFLVRDGHQEERPFSAKVFS